MSYWLNDWLIHGLIDWLIDWLMFSSEARVFWNSKPKCSYRQGMLASAGGTPEFIVDDESFEASAKKPLVETQLRLDVFLLFFSAKGLKTYSEFGWSGMMRWFYHNNCSKLRVSWVDLIVVHYDLAGALGYLGSSPNLRFFYGNSVRYP